MNIDKNQSKESPKFFTYFIDNPSTLALFFVKTKGLTPNIFTPSESLVTAARAAFAPSDGTQSTRSIEATFKGPEARQIIELAAAIASHEDRPFVS